MNKFRTSIILYRQYLKENCIGGEGLPEIIKEVPNIFSTLESLIRDKDLQSNERLMVFAAIGYFFIPDDLFPEEKLGQIGYIDDIILSLHIINEISRSIYGYDKLLRNWKLEISIDDALVTILPELMKNYPKESIGVLDYLGLIPDELDIDI